MKEVIPNYIYCLLSIGLLLACHKKEKNNIVGTYVGTEHLLQIGLYADTQSVAVSDQTIEIRLKSKTRFEIIKETYPLTFEVSADDLVKDGIIVRNELSGEGRIWIVRVKDNTLTCRFELEKWYGANEHYIFTGTKQ